MKASPRVWFVLSGLLFTRCFAQVEFVGFMTSAEGPRFALKEGKDEKSSAWLALGDSYRGFKLLAHDPQRSVLSVEKNGEQLQLPLKSDRVAHGQAPKAKISDVVIQFKGKPNVSEKDVRDTMQLRPGDELTESAVDRSIRALYRTGHFETIEIKQERGATDGFKLVVIVTPK